jgi:hypothetical protein
VWPTLYLFGRGRIVDVIAIFEKANMAHRCQAFPTLGMDHNWSQVGANSAMQLALSIFGHFAF